MATQAKINMKIRPQRGISHASPRRTNPTRLDLLELISAAIRAAHAARDKGFYTVSHEATRCVEILNQIKGMRLTAHVISASNTLPTLQYLTKNGNPKIRSEARSLLDHWREILRANGGDHEKNVDLKVSCLTRKADMKRLLRKKTDDTADSSVKNGDPREFSFSPLKGNSRPCDTQRRKMADTQSKTLIGKPELLKLFEDAKKAAEAVKGCNSSSRDASRCIKRLEQLSNVPRTLLTHDVILTVDIGSRLESLTEHSNTDIRCAARSVLDLWRTILYTTGRTNMLNSNTDSSYVERKAQITRAKIMSFLSTDSL